MKAPQTFRAALAVAMFALVCASNRRGEKFDAGCVEGVAHDVDAARIMLEAARGDLLHDAHCFTYLGVAFRRSSAHPQFAPALLWKGAPVIEIDWRKPVPRLAPIIHHPGILAMELETVRRIAASGLIETASAAVDIPRRLPFASPPAPRTALKAAAKSLSIDALSDLGLVHLIRRGPLTWAWAATEKAAVALRQYDAAQALETCLP